MFLVDGPVLLDEALAADAELETLYVEPEALNHPSVWAARAAEVRVREVTRGALRKVLDLQTPQAIFRALTNEVPDFAGMSLDGLGDLGLVLGQAITTTTTTEAQAVSA